MPEIVDGKEIWTKEEVDAFVGQAVKMRVEDEVEKTKNKIALKGDEREKYVNLIKSLDNKLVELKSKNKELIEKLIHKKKKVIEKFADKPGGGKRIAKSIDKCIERNRVE